TAEKSRPYKDANPKTGSGWSKNVQSIRTKKGGRKKEDDVNSEVHNDGQRLRKTRAQECQPNKKKGDPSSMEGSATKKW
ncbi:hypothetical protein ARMSODRAFT_959326, partial [Armillaria solidipes]